MRKTNVYYSYIHAGGHDFGLDNEDEANNGANEDGEYGAVPDEDDDSTYPSTSAMTMNEDANMDYYY
jgi:hypothetical protein